MFKHEFENKFLTLQNYQIFTQVYKVRFYAEFNYLITLKFPYFVV